MKKKSYRKNKKIIEAAKHVLVGGVNSPVRAFGYVGGDPIPIRRSHGSRIYDYDGNSYIDYVLSFGALILGHAHPRIVDSVKKTLEKGSAFGATSSREVELAELIKDAIPFIKKIRFVNSGTEAVMGAVRVARGYTKRDKILKFTNAYHGHADYFLARAGSGLATLNIPASEGVSSGFFKHTIIADYGDRDSIQDIFRKHGKEIAAIVVEPVGGNHGVIPPDIDFLRELRRLARRYGTLLIFDEVITGFRFSYGSAADIIGAGPDIICLGKIIGGGLPIGAFGGPEKIMSQLAPEGRVYQASTFAGNPVVMASGIATLKELSAGKDYRLLSGMVSDICETIRHEAQRNGIVVKVSVFQTMFSVKFAEKRQFRLFYKKLLASGIYLAPSEYESNFISFAHKRDDIERTKIALKKALGGLK